MLRNLVVTALVAGIMGITALAFRPAAPPAAQPTMEGRATIAVESSSNQAPPSQGFAMGGQTGQGAPAGQNVQSPSATVQAGGGMMGGGQATGGMMMCPCMQMMMGGRMGGGMMGAQMNQPSAAQPISSPRTKEQAKERAEQHLNSLGNPNLKVGEARETAASYEIDVVTKENSLVNRLIIDKQTGELKAQY